MEFSNLIRQRRVEMGLGIRETARQTVRPYIPSPIKSPVYITRLESGDSTNMPVASVTIDKMWALGSVLLVNPFELFLLSRGKEAAWQPHDFAVRDCAPVQFGALLHSRRVELGLSIREAVALASPWSISVPYWSQMETGFRNYALKLSGEKIWSIGMALSIDPLLLYVLSRGIDPRYLSAASRDRLFS